MVVTLIERRASGWAGAGEDSNDLDFDRDLYRRQYMRQAWSKRCYLSVTHGRADKPSDQGVDTQASSYLS